MGGLGCGGGHSEKARDQTTGHGNLTGISLSIKHGTERRRRKRRKGRHAGENIPATFGNPKFDFRTRSREFHAAATTSAHRPLIYVPCPFIEEKASNSRENHAGLNTRQNERRTCGGRSKANGLRGKHGDERLLF